MSRTPDSAARCPEHDEQPTYEEQALEDQLTKEQFDNKVEKDLENTWHTWKTNATHTQHPDKNLQQMCETYATSR